MGLRCGTCEYLKRYDGKGAKSVNVCECPDPECERIGEYRHFNNLACKFHKYIRKDYSKKVEIEKVSDIDNTDKDASDSDSFTQKSITRFRPRFAVYNDDARRNLAIAFLDAGYVAEYDDTCVTVYLYMKQEREDHDE